MDKIITGLLAVAAVLMIVAVLPALMLVAAAVITLYTIALRTGMVEYNGWLDPAIAKVNSYLK